MDQQQKEIGEVIQELMDEMLTPTMNLEDTLNVRRSSRLAEPRNFKPPGFYKSTKQKGKSGGNVCDDKIVRMAVDAAIVLGGTAAIAPVAYIGYHKLFAFMNLLGVSDAAKDSISAVYQIVATSNSLAYDIASAASDIAPSVLTALKSSVKPTALISPFFLLKRYTTTEKNAIEDAKNLYAALEKQYTNLKNVTSAVNKKTKNLSKRLDGINEKIKVTGTIASNAVTNTANDFKNLSDLICKNISDVRKTETTIYNEIYRIIGPFYNILPGKSSGGKSKSRKSKSRKSKSRKSKSRKSKSRK